MRFVTSKCAVLLSQACGIRPLFMIGATGFGAEVMIILSLLKHLLFASSVTVTIYVATPVSDIRETEMLVSLMDHLYDGSVVSFWAVRIYEAPLHSVSLPALLVIFISGE